jgi:purine-binding chemotaxis protein CheW
MSCIPADVHQYLSFRLGGLEYALDYRKVRELRPLDAMDDFAGDGEADGNVIVTRGAIMPIVDMRSAFSARPAAASKSLDVIVLELTNCVIGMVTDGVSDVVTLRNGQIRPFRELDQDADYLVGIAEASGRGVIVIDIDKLMSVRGGGPGSRNAA